MVALQRNWQQPHQAASDDPQQYIDGETIDAKVLFIDDVDSDTEDLVHLVINSARNSVAYYRDGAFVSNNTLSDWNPSGTNPEGMWLGRRAERIGGPYRWQPISPLFVRRLH